ncbi:hypothetical protein MKW98_028557 [Papaver atlanticum]|uniref:NADP-dependent oxidoreductase domain-containing protein n=1 Tax=Papaver atlanticum TaxID=357466 RepID=A0AAD4TA86_9MAGN|nr:hypothetical protein MKW98_028557 [Papaver atlanticum]
MKLGSQGFEVSKQGLGCMGMSASYGPAKPDSDMIALIHRAIDKGVTFLDTSDIYGPYTNEVLIGKALVAKRDKVELATKFGINFESGSAQICGNPEYVRAACEASLKRLQVDCIDLYYQHRIDTNVPIEVTGSLRRRLLPLGEHIAVHPITAVQLEWSLWSRDIEEDIVPTCRELGIGIVAYSPLGRGFFASGAKMVDNLADNDFRKSLPRFLPENLQQNKSIFERVSELALKKGCTTSQLALAWFTSSRRLCPIPGTTKIENLAQNIGALSVKLTASELAELESLASADAVKGDRYGGAYARTWKNSDTPELSSS